MRAGGPVCPSPGPTAAWVGSMDQLGDNDSGYGDCVDSDSVDN
jgi:hypothetical protein